MASKYVTGYNPIQDFLFQSMLYGLDLSDKKHFVDIQSAIVYILQNVLKNENDVIHLDFEIKGNKNYIKLVGKNIISALWLSGVFPQNVDKVLNDNKYIVDDISFNYNKKTRKLTYTINN
jgi:hypothetical protein